MPLIIKKGIPEQVVVSDCGRMAGVFSNGKCLKVFSCDDFDACVREGKPIPQVEAERYVRSLREPKQESQNPVEPKAK